MKIQRLNPNNKCDAMLLEMFWQIISENQNNLILRYARKQRLEILSSLPIWARWLP
jgi:hypothetical protein